MVTPQDRPARQPVLLAAGSLTFAAYGVRCNPSSAQRARTVELSQIMDPALMGCKH